MVASHTVGVLVPSLAGLAFILPLLGKLIKNVKFFHIYAVLTSLWAAILATYNAYLVFTVGIQVYPFGGWPPPLGIAYELDKLNALLGMVTALVMLAITVYSTWYLRDYEGVAYYYTLLLGLETGLIGCLYTGDAFNLFVMLEVLSISAYALVGFYRSKPEAVEAAIKYGMFGAVATTLYFIGLVFIYAAFGTLNMADLAFKLTFYTHYPVPNPFSGTFFGNPYVATAVALALALWTFTYKSATFPNHFWLPDAHPEAPTPVSAALSGLVVNVGVYAVFRFLYTIFGPSAFIVQLRDVVLMVLLSLGIASGLIGALMMVVQEDIKRLLAYSTISHIGLVLVGVAIGTSSTLSQNSLAYVLGLAGGIYHMINHTLGKALLFLAAGILIFLAGGSRKLDDISGVGRKYPLLGLALFLGVFQLLGVPPFGGFFSKLLIYSAYMEVGMPYVSLLVILISAISLLGYVKLIYASVFKVGYPKVEETTKISLPTAVVLALGIACLATGLATTYITSVMFDIIKSVATPQGVFEYWRSFFNTLLDLASGVIR